MYCKQALLIDAFSAFNRIHLNHVHIGVLPPECKVVRIGPADPAAAVLLHVLPEAFLSRPVAYFPWKIEVADILEHAGIDICVYGLRRIAYDLLSDGLDDVVDGLPLPESVSKERAQLGRLILRDGEPGAASAEGALILLLRILRLIQMLLKSAFRHASAAVADVRGADELFAFLLDIRPAEGGHAE